MFHSLRMSSDFSAAHADTIGRMIMHTQIDPSPGPLSSVCTKRTLASNVDSMVYNILPSNTIDRPINLHHNLGDIDMFIYSLVAPERFELSTFCS